ncbi:MAG: Tfp pilus assembly protein FimT/FimU [Nitrospinota bacterium]
MKTQKKSLGLTLIEVLIALSIVLIVTAISIPSLLEVLPKVRVKNAANMIKTDILWARMKAVSSNNNYIMTFGEPGPVFTNNSYAIYNDSDNDFGTVHVEPAELVKNISIPVMEKGIVFGYVPGLKTTNNSDDLEDDPVKFTTGGASDPRWFALKPNGLPSLSGTIYIIPEKDIANNRTDRMRAIQVLNSGRIKIWEYQNNLWK